MDQFDNCCHHHLCTSGPNHTRIVPAAYQSLDTVQALHQTVVSLRQTLEKANLEIKSLKNRIAIKEYIDKGKKYHSQLNIDSIRDRLNFGGDENENKNVQKIEDTFNGTHQSTTSLNEENQSDCGGSDRKSKVKKQNKRHSNYRNPITTNEHQYSIVEIGPTETDIELKTLGNSASKKYTQMASKIDVKIRLTSNVQIDENGSGSELTSESSSASPRESSSNILDVKVNTKTETTDDSKRSENKKLGVMDIVEPVDENVQSDDLEIIENKSSAVDDEDGAVGGVDDSEGLDDIELIFSSDDKELPQEDLVSISYYEPWQLCGKSGTPILVNFNSISSETSRVHDEVNDSNLSEPLSSIDPNQFYNAIKENVEHSIESEDRFCVKEYANRKYDYQMKAMHLNKCDDNVDEVKELKPNDSFDTFKQPEYLPSMSGRRLTNYKVLQETDISKIGAIAEVVPDKERRNTCPNSSAYQPIIHREALIKYINNGNKTTLHRCPLAVKFAPNAQKHLMAINSNYMQESDGVGPRRSTSAQTEISALPDHWRSESHLMGGILGDGFFTLPSKFVTTPGGKARKNPLKIAERTREARRVLLSDINFTSMVPELSRSADHLCHGDEQQGTENDNEDDNEYIKGPLLKTPDYLNCGLAPSMSFTSPGESQWTVNENSFGTQTDNQWSIQQGDSFDSCKSFSIGSKLSFGNHNRSRSCPSVRCALCKHRHHGGIKTSESLNHASRVTFHVPKTNKIRGSLPNLSYCVCSCLCSKYAIRYDDSCGSTESILGEADDFLRLSIDGAFLRDSLSKHSIEAVPERCSENDLHSNDFSPPKNSPPFLPYSTKCLKPGYWAKVITKNGSVVIGRVRYIGPLVSTIDASTSRSIVNDIYVGLQLQSKIGECNGSFEGRKIFDCEPQHGIFVPFKKVVMAWKS